MKSRILLPLLALFLTLSAQAQAPKTASQILDDAYVTAKTEHKNVFVKYKASWCGWCKRMDKQMKTGEAAPFFDRNFVMVDFTVDETDENKKLETPGADELRKSFHGDEAGLPFWVILDENGELLKDSFDSNHQNLGCPATEEEVAQFTAILESTSDLKKQDLDLITEIFVLKK